MISVPGPMYRSIISSRLLILVRASPWSAVSPTRGLVGINDDRIILTFSLPMNSIPRRMLFPSSQARSSPNVMGLCMPGAKISNCTVRSAGGKAMGDWAEAIMKGKKSAMLRIAQLLMINFCVIFIIVGY